MMNFLRRLAAVAFLLFAASTPSLAQFANQATYAGDASGSSSAQGITLPNMVNLADILGVPITWVPSVANTGAVTLAINSGTATNIQVPTNGGLADLGGGELQSGQPVMTMYNGTVHVLLSINGILNTPVFSFNLDPSVLTFSAPINAECDASVAANALTITLNAGDVNAPVLAIVRDATAASGAPVLVTVNSPISITVPSGATIGTVSGQASRLWVGLFDDAGTPVLGVYNSLNSSGPSILPWDETTATNGTAITSGATSSQVWYTSSAVSAKSFTPLCYVESTQSAAGTWASSPSKVQLFGPGVKRPSDVLSGPLTKIITSVDTTTSATYVALTDYQTSITPRSAANVIKVTLLCSMESSALETMGSQLSRGNTAATGLFGNATIFTAGANGFFGAVALAGYDLPNTTSSQTYATQAKTAGGTLTMGNGNPCLMTVEEVQI